MSAQVTATAPPLSNDLANYNNRWDAYGGFGYARFQTTLGVNLKSNLYGWKGQVTGWLNPIVGITASTGNYYGNVSLSPNQYDLSQANISEHLFLFGPEVRLLRDPKWTVSAHVLVGGTYGIFDNSFPSGVQPNRSRTISAMQAAVMAEFTFIRNGISDHFLILNGTVSPSRSFISSSLRNAAHHPLCHRCEKLLVPNAHPYERLGK